MQDLSSHNQLLRELANNIVKEVEDLKIRFSSVLAPGPSAVKSEEKEAPKDPCRQPYGAVLANLIAEQSDAIAVSCSGLSEAIASIRDIKKNCEL